MANFDNPKYSIKMMNRVYKTNVNVSRMDEGSFTKLIKEMFYKRNIFHNYDLSPYAFGLNYEFNTPMLFIGGWYDMFIEHMMRDVMLIQKNAPDFFREKFKMIIGPWSHMNIDKFLLKPLKYSHLKDDFRFFQNILPFWWYDCCLKGDQSLLSEIPPLQIYILNKDIWRSFYKWPPTSTDLKLYLHSDGNSNSLNGDGSLSKNRPKEESPDQYLFDPSNPVITKGGRNLFLLSGPQDQTDIERRDDILIFTTNALERGLEIIGEVKITIYASTTVEDTDFMVKLVDVYPNNKKSINLIDSGIRTRYRNGNLDEPELVAPNKIYKFEIVIGSIAVFFPKNHKIRLEITSSNFPRFDVNSNLAGNKNKKNYQIATQTIFHDKDHPSHIIIPVFNGKENN
jgi:hypothetical protein